MNVGGVVSRRLSFSITTRQHQVKNIMELDQVFLSQGKSYCLLATLALTAPLFVLNRVALCTGDPENTCDKKSTSEPPGQKKFFFI